MPEPTTTQENQESSQDQTQQTNNQENQHISFDPDYVASLEARIAEQQIQNRRLETLVESVRELRENNNNVQQTTPTRNVEEDRNRFYQDPVGILDNRLDERDAKILNEMKKMLAPLQEVASSFRSNNEYDKLKNIMKVDPIFGKGLRDPDVENLVDSIMRNPGVKINEDTMKSAIAQAMGMKSMGGIGTSTINKRTNNTNNDDERIDPPTITPSRHRVPAPPTSKTLTENDRLAMKHANLNPNNPKHVEEYWSLIGDETMVLSVHKPKKES